MKLVEEGRLALDDRVAPFIAHLTPQPGATVDPRWEQITIRQLLNHTGGWDRARPNGGFDPMDRPAIAAAAVGAPAPASAETIIRYMKGMPLDFNPGEKARLLELRLRHPRSRDRARERHAVRGVRARTRAAARGREPHAVGAGRACATRSPTR
jgi:hypothetical protein